MKKRTAFIICSLAVQLMTVPAYAAGWDHDMYFSHEKRAIIFDFSEVRLLLPEEWEGRIAIEQTEKEIRFYHDASRLAWMESGKTDASENGLLFALGVAEDYQLPETDSENWYGTVGSGTEGLYYLKKPTAMRGSMGEDSIWNSWSETNCLMPWVTAELIDEADTERTQSGESQIPVDDYTALIEAGGSMMGTVLERETDESTSQTKILLQADDGRKLTFTSCQWTSRLRGECGDYVQLIWLGDLYGQPLIQYMSRTSSRESYDEGIKEARGKVCSLDGDELGIQTALGGTFRLTDQMAVKPDEYTLGSTVRVEYLGERITGYLVRVTELDN